MDSEIVDDFDRNCSRHIGDNIGEGYIENYIPCHVCGYYNRNCRDAFDLGDTLADALAVLWERHGPWIQAVFADDPYPERKPVKPILRKKEK